MVGTLWSICAGRAAGVLGPNVVAFGIGLGMYGLLTLVMMLVQSDGTGGFGLGHDVAVAGWVLVPYAVLSVSGNRLARAVATRRGPDLPLPARGRRLRVVDAAAGAGPMAFNQLLGYLGFAVGSATSVALVGVFGGGGTGFRVAVLALASGCLLVGRGVAVGRRTQRRYSI